MQLNAHGKTETVKLEVQDTILITSVITSVISTPDHSAVSSTTEVLLPGLAKTRGERREDIKSASFMLGAISWLLQAPLPTVEQKGGWVGCKGEKTKGRFIVFSIGSYFHSILVFFIKTLNKFLNTLLFVLFAVWKNARLLLFGHEKLF